MASKTARAFLLCLSCVLVCAPAAALAQTGEDKRLEMELRGWAPTFSGSIQSAANGNVGADLDFESQLGIDTQQNFLLPKLLPRLADRHRLSMHYMAIQYAGDSRLDQEVNFGGTTFTIGEAIRAEFDIKQGGLTYEYDVLRDDRFAAFLSARMDVLRIEAVVKGNTIGTRAERATVPVPTAGGGFHYWPADWLKIGGRISGVKGGVGGYEGELIDAEGFVTVSPWDWLGLGIGYRYYRGMGRDEDTGDQLDWLQKGPFLSLTIRPF